MPHQTRPGQQLRFVPRNRRQWRTAEWHCIPRCCRTTCLAFRFCLLFRVSRNERHGKCQSWPEQQNRTRRCQCGDPVYRTGQHDKLHAQWGRRRHLYRELSRSNSRLFLVGFRKQRTGSVQIVSYRAPPAHSGRIISHSFYAGQHNQEVTADNPAMQAGKAERLRKYVTIHPWRERRRA